MSKYRILVSDLEYRFGPQTVSVCLMHTMLEGKRCGMFEHVTCFAMCDVVS